MPGARHEPGGMQREARSGPPLPRLCGDTAHILRPARSARFCVAGHSGLLLVRNEPLASIVQEAMEGFAAGRFETQAEVKRFLESQPSFPRKDRNGSVSFQVVADILTKLLYAGYIEHAEWGVTAQKGKHEPLISLETFERIQDRINRVARAPMGADIRSDFPLRGSVCCAECGKPMSACWSTSSTGMKYPYYLCVSKGCARYRKSVRRDTIESAFANLLKMLVPSKKLFELAVNFLSKPYELWVSGNLHIQKLVLKLTFADRLAYSPENGFSNAKATMPFKLLESLREGKVEMAHPSGFEPVIAQYMNSVRRDFAHSARRLESSLDFSAEQSVA